MKLAKLLATVVLLCSILDTAHAATRLSVWDDDDDSSASGREQSGSESGSGWEKQDAVTATWKLVTSPPRAPDTQCQPLTIPMCKILSYRQVSLPNSFNHQTQEEAGLEIHQFYPLVQLKCSSSLPVFLCVLYAPPCQNAPATVDPVLPCKSLCEKAKTGCAPIMNKFGYEWPDALSCEKFPDGDISSQSCISRDEQLG